MGILTLSNTEKAAAVRNEAVAACTAADLSLADIGRVLILPPSHVTVGGLDDGDTLVGCVACRETVNAVLEPASPVRAYVVELRCWMCDTSLVSWDQFSGDRS